MRKTCAPHSYVVVVPYLATILGLRASFCCCRIFKQPLVPVLDAEDGRWLLPQGLSPMLKPGGHGAIWKLMLDAGVFEWLGHHGRQAAIVRQIRYRTVCGIDLRP